MSNERSQRVQRGSCSQTVVSRERGSSFAAKDLDVLRNWWGWMAWSGMDSKLAVFLPKRIPDEQHTPTPDDPWF